ncbi:GNAT family N-acetyltransferase [Galbibacter sp. PAP.153]|uniref:GNAT family N-acetyltransferase n=1 Tax=Galbibacter sp. PAP.153 TaxID=3104623 RepID=UPI00300ACBEE
MLEIEVKPYNVLTKEELYELLQLRSEVFVVEQNCVYQDVDYKDQKALHVLGKKGNKLVAYTRIFNAGEYFKNPSIGRVVVKKEERKFGYGHNIVQASIEAITTKFNHLPIEISAQCYLIKFYKTHGFEQLGEEYLEDGIPHVKMIRN